ncbi:MAG: COQ9 family protein [Litoreibacter sp.]
MNSILKDQILDAALSNVAFDGWADATFDFAISQAGVDLATAEVLFPRKGLDLAIAFHKRGDAKMVEAMEAKPLEYMRYRDRVAAAVRFRLEAVGADKEAVRRGSSMFALPQNAMQGATLIWGTADTIWNGLGDESIDYNWYTKRVTLSGVYGSTVLFWLGDESEDHTATWEFLDRRIDNVMELEKVKAQVNAHPVASKMMAGPNWLLSKLKAPTTTPDPDLPGHIAGEEQA